MITVNLSEQEMNIWELLKLAALERVLLRTPDGQEFVVIEMDDFEQEVDLIQQNQELMQFLDQRSGEKETFSLEQVAEILNLR